MFKYALLLVVALCAVQGFEARTVQLDDRGIEDVTNAIKEIFQKIKDAIATIVAQIPALIQNIHDDVQQILEVTDLPGFIAEVKEELKHIIALGQGAKECVEVEREGIEDLIQNAEAVMDACLATAQSEYAPVKEQLAALQVKANELYQDVSGRVVNCVEDSQMNPIDLYICLKDQVDPVNEELAQFQQEIQDTIANVNESAEKVADRLAVCAEEARDEAVDQIKNIISGIQNCAAESG